MFLLCECFFNLFAFECVVGLYSWFAVIVWWFRDAFNLSLSSGLYILFCLDGFDFVCLGSLFWHLRSLIINDFSLYGFI